MKASCLFWILVLVSLICLHETSASRRHTKRSGGKDCLFVTLKSTDATNAKKDIREIDPNAGNIVSVTVTSHLSGTECTEWENLFYYNSYILVTSGCSGIIKVCYTKATLELTTVEPGKVKQCTKLTIVKDRTRKFQGPNGESAEIVKVQLIDEISSSRCTEGITYFYVGSKFAIKGGCRGIFEVCYVYHAVLPTDTFTVAPRPGPSNCYTIKLSSTQTQDDTQQITDTNGNPVEVVKLKLKKQISSVECTRDETFEFHGTRVTARKGCEGLFLVCYKPVPVGPLTALPPISEPNVVVITLKSLSGTTATKTFPSSLGVISKVTIIRERGDSRCVHGVTYGFTGNTVYAKDGCEADFKVHFISPFTASPTDPEQKSRNCYKITLTSTQTQDDTKQIIDKNGNPVEVVKLKLKKQKSSVECTRDETFEFHGTRVTARKGCAGLFVVCYKPVPVGPLTGSPPISEPNVVIITLKSLSGTTATKTFPSSLGVIGKVTVIRERGDSRCVHGVTYWFTGNTVFVKDGCEADFEVRFVGSFTASPTGPRQNVVITLKSSRGHKATKTFPSSFGVISQVTVIRDRSYNRCVQGTTYGFIGNTVYAKDGCEADFEVRFAGPFTATPDVPRPDVVITLKSSRGNKATKTFPSSCGVISQVTVIRDRSDNRCVQGTTYGFIGNTVYAKDGCEADFEVRFAGPFTATPDVPRPGQDNCYEITLNSTEIREETQHISDQNGGPAEVVKLKLIQQYSQVKCNLWQTFEFQGSRVTACKGCAGRFVVCFRSVVPPLELTEPPEPSRFIIQLKSKVGESTRRVIPSDRGIISAVTVIRDLGKKNCLFGVNYGFKGNTVYVKHGCSGLFEVIFAGALAVTPVAPRPLPGKQCTNVKLFSTLDRAVAHRITGENNEKVAIIYVRLVRQEPDSTSCQEWDTYLFDKDRVEASGGCKGEFLVCYKIVQ